MSLPKVVINCHSFEKLKAIGRSVMEFSFRREMEYLFGSRRHALFLTVAIIKLQTDSQCAGGMFVGTI
jgi:hypothetical protein